ncbi:MAG: thiamine-phosphate kinase [Rhodocyclaceae bacterium]
MASEFDLIQRFFTRPVSHTVLGVGDDGAVIRPRPGMDLVISTDMLVAGTHFLPDTDPEALGRKALAVNLSDLAAMGAEPRWALLAAALPAPDEDWIAAFCRGFFGLAAEFGVDVIGGDTTRGPLNLTPTVFGEVPVGQAVTRSGARVGDTIWVSGAPGRAALGLAHLQGRTVLAEPGLSACLDALQRPQPRVALGAALRGLAHAAIDVSDGLLADLSHILEQSGVAAEVDEAQLAPGAYEDAPDADAALARQCVLGGGDDYELLFTAAPEKAEAILRLGQQVGVPLTAVGRIVEGASPSILLRDRDGRIVPPPRSGYDHFL